ncbi:fimbria/pilus periplasmic chaperone [Sphingomonas cannabina]|uniref:fimbrial biogenesis chaperone n=1 Tax=Sphingomonas cannabina TaxID=2899123 RepID=UPI001F425E4A|nr:fimbria/pilus periplasmic chaperone [Sphingomonas cannabina]UIJ46867.1 fimbria/pilus periplasmic chaperone [Sphingomonas cannabina]
MRTAWRFGAALVAATLVPFVGYAAALKVFPVRIVLTPAQPVQTMTIENDSDEPSRVQLRVYAWRQDQGEDVFEETRDVLANPALFEVAPGGTQIARFGLRTAPGTTEKAYRVFLEEVPTERPSRPGEVRTLLRISIPIFVPPPQQAPMQLVWRAVPAGPGQVQLLVRNEGAAHVQINRLALHRPGGAALGARDVSLYLLPGTAKAVMLDSAAPVVAGQALRLDAMTDQKDVSVDLVTEAAGRDAGRP